MESWKNISIKVQIYNFPSTGNTRIDDLGSKSYLALYVYVITDIEEDLKIPKGLIKSRKSKKVRQHNDQKKKNKRTNNDAQKTKDRATGTPLKTVDALGYYGRVGNSCSTICPHHLTQV